MYIHYKPNILTIDWTIYRGVSKTKEDFSRAQLAAFVFNRHNKIFVNASEDDGTLTLQIPAELPSGTYSLMAIWTKNHERSLQRAIADNVFAVSEFPADATYHGGAPMEEPLKVKSSAGTFGYDGLSAYELAVIKGMTVKSENEWTEAAVDTAEAEKSRKTNETQRQAAETSRVNAEIQRDSAEQGRASTFQQLAATMETAVGQNLDTLEQTSTSTESGGVNIITATFRNGQTQTFQVHNGAQGDQGPQGEAGPQGPQGNSGYSGAAGELEVVNNLTDGGATAALSAEMGKQLAQNMVHVKGHDDVVLTSKSYVQPAYTVKSGYYLRNTGVLQSGSGYNVFCYAVTAGQVIWFKQGFIHSNAGFYAFASSIEGAGTITQAVTAHSDDLQIVTVPQGATYFIVNNWNKAVDDMPYLCTMIGTPAVADFYKLRNYVGGYDLSKPVVAEKDFNDSAAERRGGLFDKDSLALIQSGNDFLSVGATHWLEKTLPSATTQAWTICRFFASQLGSVFYATNRLRAKMDLITSADATLSVRMYMYKTSGNVGKSISVGVTAGKINHLDLLFDAFDSADVATADYFVLVIMGLATPPTLKVCNLVVTDEQADLEGRPVNRLSVEQACVEQRNTYEGRQMIYIGDSISTSNAYRWKGYLDTQYNLRNFIPSSDQDVTPVGPAQGGITICAKADGKCVNQSASGRYSIWYRCAEQRMSAYDFDMINLFGGTNDRISLNALGTVSDKPFVDDASSFATPANYVDTWAEGLTFAQFYMGCIEMLKRDFPTKEIILCTLLPNTANLTVDEANNCTEGESKSALIVRIANKYGLKVVPWFWGIYNENAYTIASFTQDGIHPNQTLGRLMAERYANVLGLKYYG